MGKSIYTLVPDIHKLLGRVAQGGSAGFTEQELAELGAEIANAVSKQLNRGTKVRKPRTLYMSEVGQPCSRKLWYKYNRDLHGDIPQEPLHPNAVLKFLYGDIIESVVLALAKKAGHAVEDEQKAHSFEMDGWEVRGRQDARIDGHLVDVKSASSFAMGKFKEGLSPEKDSFGYLGQLSLYLEDGDTKASFLAVDKQTGGIVLDTHDLGDTLKIREEVVAPKVIALEGLTPPEIQPEFQPVPEGKSGNTKLCTNCSYCDFKHTCWEGANGGAGLRGFLYSTGPRWFTNVAVEPRVMEIEND